MPVPVGAGVLLVLLADVLVRVVVVGPGVEELTATDVLCDDGTVVDELVEVAKRGKRRRRRTDPSGSGQR